MNERWVFRLTAKVIKSENLTFPMYMFLSESLIIAMADIDAKIKAQGDKIRELKTAKTGKDVIDPKEKILLALKAEFKVCLFHVNIL